VSGQELATEGVAVAFGGRPVLEEVTMVASPGRILAISGASGVGKTTLLFVLAGLIIPDSGVVRYGERALGGALDPQRPRQGLILQTFGLSPVLTAHESAAFPLQLLGCSRREIGERTAAVLDSLGLRRFGDQLTTELSGGQQQRLAVAGALVTRPAFVLADEPTSQLDAVWSAAVVDLLRASAREGAIVIICTRDPSVLESSDDALVLGEHQCD
jgi:putative ABC transport system ATP-binding protein